MVGDFRSNFAHRLEGKLYERKKEQTILLNAYQRVSSHEIGETELVLILGGSGTGKTELARAVQRPVEEDGGIYISGKFDQLQRPEPYAAFVAAFTEFSNLVVELGEERIKSMKDAIMSAVGSEGRIITDMIPSLKRIVGEQNQGTSVHGIEAQNRFKFVFRMFVRAICCVDHPLVLLLDDLQWADQASLDLLLELAKDSDNKGLLLMLTLRDNEVSEIHPFTKMLRALERETIPITRVALSNLKQATVNEMLTDLMEMSPQHTESLAKILHEQTGGNVFFVVQFLKSLFERGLLHNDPSEKCWRWDEERILHSLHDTANVVELLKGRMRGLDETTQQVLQVAACIGTEFDEVTVRLALEKPITEALEQATSENLIAFVPDYGVYKFHHDKIQLAAYSLVPEKEIEEFHITVGRRLWKNSSAKQLDVNMFIVVDQMSRGANLLVDTQEKLDLASLNLRAGERATLLSAFEAAANYFGCGISLLGEGHWRDQYDLSLALHNAAAEAEYCCGHFKKMYQRIFDVFQNAKSFEDKVRAHLTHVYGLGTQGKLQEALSEGFSVLRQLGESFPSKARPAYVLMDLYRTKFMLRGKSNAALLRLPQMVDSRKLAAMQMLKLVSLYCYLCKPEFQPLVVFRMVQISLRHGISAMSGVAFSAYGMTLSGVFQEMENGYRFGQLALALVKKFHAKEWIARVHCLVYGCTNHWTQPLQSSLKPLKYAQRVGLETGDLEYSMNDASLYIFNSFESGKPLPQVEKAANAYVQQMVYFKQDTWLMITSPLCQVLLNLRGTAEDARTLSGKAMDWRVVLKDAVDQNNTTLLCLMYSLQMLVSFLFGDYDIAAEMAKKSRSVDMDLYFIVCTRSLFESLTALAMARTGSKPGRIPSVVLQGLKKFKRWAKYSPQNCSHKLLLLEAEIEALNGNKENAVNRFQLAADAAAKDGFIQYQALASERAASYLRHCGDENMASPFFQRAYDLYSRWGANAKAEHLKGTVASLQVKPGASLE